MTRWHAADERGFTLIELMVVIVVLVVVAGAIVSFAVNETIQTARQSVQENLLETAHTGLDRMANDIRLSATADDNNRWPDLHSPAAPANLYSWQSNASTLVLATAAQTSNGTILFSDHADYITTKDNYVYFLQNGTLYKRIIAAIAPGNAAVTTCPAGAVTALCPADKTVLTNVQSLSIQYFDGLNNQVDPASAQSIQLNTVLQTKSFGALITARYSTRMVFRNG